MKSKKEESMKDTITIVWWCYQHDRNNDDVIITMISIVIKSLWWISSTKKFFWPHFRNEWSTVSKDVSTSYYHLPQCVHETLLCKLWRTDYCKYFLFDPIISAFYEWADFGVVQKFLKMTWNAANEIGIINFRI